MYIDLLKSSSASQEHMEMMLMMQMDKISEIAGAAYSEIPMIDFSGGQGSCSNNNNNNSPTMGGGEPTFMNLPSTISFSGSLQGHQDPSTYPFSSSKWRNNASCGDLAAGATTFLGDSHYKNNSVAAMREMIFRIAAMQPIHIDPESVKPPKRRNVKISKDPQSVAARHRRERISERIRTLQRLVPGGTKMDTASMLDEAIHYVKFLKNQVQSLERAAATRPASGIGFPVPMTSGNYLSMAAATKGYQAHQNVQHYADA